jgi:hypothetical protein
MTPDDERIGADGVLGVEAKPPWLRNQARRRPMGEVPFVPDWNLKHQGIRNAIDQME